jgi:hypothetical protein
MFSEDPLPLPARAKIQLSLNIEAVCFWRKSETFAQFSNDANREATVI